MQMNRSWLARAAAVCGAVSLLLSCGGGKTETAGAPGGTSVKPKTASIEPVARPAGVKVGLKLTTFPNNRFTGPGETTAEVTTIGFPCDANPYKDKEVSLRYQGYFKVDKDGTYSFQINSDDQSKLKLGPAVVVDNENSTHTTEGSANLKTGLYPLQIDYQNNVGAACLSVNWKSESAGNVWLPMSAAQLLHE
jgi:hypothetical protein